MITIFPKVYYLLEHHLDLIIKLKFFLYIYFNATINEIFKRKVNRKINIK